MKDEACRLLSEFFCNDYDRETSLFYGKPNRPRGNEAMKDEKVCENKLKGEQSYESFVHEDIQNLFYG